jgi:hypothetical protein
LLSKFFGSFKYSLEMGIQNLSNFSTKKMMVLLLFPHCFTWKLDHPKWIGGRGMRGKGKGLHYLWGFHVLCNEILMKFPFIIGVFKALH